MREPIGLWVLLPMRLWAGWVMGRAGLAKAMGGWLHEPKLPAIITGWLTAGKPYGFYAPFLRNVVLPHDGLFSFLVVAGELAVGAALLLGLLARPAALGGLVMVLAFLFGQGDPLVGANPTSAMAVAMLTLALAAPGRALGLDAALRGRVSPWITGA
jgi:thiosulfate dehydrogenase [quinone] large subunit